MLLFLQFVFTGILTSAALQACDQVNSFIATNGLAYGYGGINPGAQYPFAPFRLGPDTTTHLPDLTWRHFSGYNYQDLTIKAFSHTHLVGAGVNDLGSVGVMPLTLGRKDERNFPLNSWWSQFNKTTESASPGFYSVYLDEPQTKVELMAVSTLAGVHRYTWDSLATTNTPALVIDMCHDSKIHRGEGDNRCLDADLTINSEQKNVFSGHVHTKGGLSNGQIVYIYAELHDATNDRNTDSIVDSWTMCTKESDAKLPQCRADLTTLTASEHLYGIAKFNHKPLTSSSWAIDLRIAISYISVDQAKLNYQEAFAETTSFETLASRTKNVWCELLSFISATPLEGDVDPDFLTMFYSASYRAFMSPSDYTEAGGVYKGLDLSYHNATEERAAKYGPAVESSQYQYHWFSDLSLWDTFRTLHPWLLLVDEDLAMAVARSMTEMTIQQNALPRWVLGSHESSCMLGEHGAAFLVEMIGAGLGKELDMLSVQKIFLPQSTQSWPVNGRTDVDHYMTAGFVSQDVSSDATVETLSYAFDDYLLGKISEFVGDQDSADAAFQRSQNYRLIWSKEQSIFCPKYADGHLDCPEDPVNPLTWSYYREGDAYHYAWFVPHDPEGLVSLYDSPQAFDAALQGFLSNHVPYFEKFGNAVPNPYYWAGNEHDFLAPWLFNVGPNCTNSQYWTRKLTYLHFSNTPHGIPGNDDYGAMSTWFLFASLGLFPQAGTTRFFLGAPRVQSAQVRLRHWKRATTTLSIETINNSPNNTFIDKLVVNGEEWKQPFLDRSVLTAADVKLQFYMHDSPRSGLCEA